MCERCGCREYIRQGKERVLERAVQVVNELRLSARNVADYEDAELICSLIAPFGTRTDEVMQTAVWVSDLHVEPGLVNRNARYDDYVRAFRSVFGRLPGQGDPRHIATVYHQLEQLNKELSDANLASVDAGAREALQALRTVHDDPAGREARLKQRYAL